VTRKQQQKHQDTGSKKKDVPVDDEEEESAPSPSPSPPSKKLRHTKKKDASIPRTASSSSSLKPDPSARPDTLIISRPSSLCHTRLDWDCKGGYTGSVAEQFSTKEQMGEPDNGMIPDDDSRVEFAVPFILDRVIVNGDPTEEREDFKIPIYVSGLPHTLILRNPAEPVGEESHAPEIWMVPSEYIKESTLNKIVVSGTAADVDEDISEESEMDKDFYKLLQDATCRPLSVHFPEGSGMRVFTKQVLINRLIVYNQLL